MSTNLELKNKIKKNIRKYIPVLCTLFLIPCISFNAFAFTVPISSMPIHPDVGASAGIYIYDEFVGDVEIPIVYDYGEFSYEFHTDVDTTSVEAFNFSIAPGFNPSFNLEVYDYYLAFNIYFSDSRSYLNVDIVNLFAPKKSASYDEQEFDLLDVRTANGYFNDNDIYDGVVTVVGRIPDEYNSLPISDILLICNGGRIYASQYNEITSFLYQVPKGTDEEVVNSLIDAINNQSDLIENGNSGTQSNISDFNQVFDEFNNELENWEAFDDEIIGEFNDANEQYLNELNNFELSDSLLLAGNWLSTSMQTVYDASSDYKMLWLVPLLFGLPILLFVIKKSGGDNE